MRFPRRKNFNNLIVIVLAIFFEIFTLDAFAFVWSETEWNNNRPNPVKYRINATGAPKGFQSEVINAFNTWNKVISADIAFVFDGLTNSGYIRDSINTISWSVLNPFREQDTLAQTNRTSVGRMLIEADIQFDGSENYSTTGFSNSVDIQSVALHEIGHFLGLNHSLTKPSVMLPYYSGVQRNLYQDDIDGIKFIYDSTPPTLQLKDDLNKPIAPDNITNRDSIIATAQDSAPGMYQITLTQLPAETIIQSRNFEGQTHTVTASFSNIGDGSYKITALDLRTNTKEITFTIDSKPSSVAGYSPQGSDAEVGSPIVIAFTKALDETTITNGSMAVYDGWARVWGDVRYVEEERMGIDINGDGDKTDYILTFNPQGGYFPAGKEIEVFVFDSIRGKNGMRMDGNGDGREDKG